jgi:hypothetical protein
MGQTLHAEKPNKLLHFDFLYTGHGLKGVDYILVLKDDLSSYCRLIPSVAANAVTTAAALIDWFAPFGVVLDWGSDRGSHFKNVVVRQLREQNHSSHLFTLEYWPWSNGTVEVVNRKILRVLRALCSELNIPFREWPNLLPLAQGVLNSAILPRLGNRSPLTAMTGLPADLPLASITTSSEVRPRAVKLAETRALQRQAIESTLAALDSMHKEVAEKSSLARQRAIDRINAKVGVRPCNFQTGDFVLRGVLPRHQHPKLALRWVGPYRIVRVLTGFIFILQHLFTGDKCEVHRSRVLYFRKLGLRSHEGSYRASRIPDWELHTVSEFVDVRVWQGSIEVRARWCGHEAWEDTWESVKAKREDVPVLLQSYIDVTRSSGTGKQKSILVQHHL